MKILYISNYKRGVGGINAQVDLLHTYLNQEDGIKADVFSTKGNPLRRCIAFFLLLCKARRYDVLHIHACSYWGMVPAVMGVIAGKLWRKRIIITYHGGGAEEYFVKHAAFVRRWLGRANQVVVLSGFLKEIFDHYDIPCVVIPNIVVLQPQIERTRDIAPRFISIRHLEPLYNIPCILRAYEQVLKVHPDATLDILGQGSQREELEIYVQEHQLTGVTFVGQVPNQQIYDYLAKADIMLSAPKIDNMPVSLLEAMNAGLLVISSRVGGVPYMINEELLASPKSSPKGKDFQPTPNPFNQPILNPSLKGRTLDTTEQSPFPSGEGRGEASFAQVWGAHTADSTQYDVLKENAVSNRKNPTEAESVLWDMMKGNKLGAHFRRQHIILDYIVDFICLDKGLIIELDGGYHDDPQQKEYDKARTAHLQRLGYTELRFKNEELLCNPDAVIHKINDTLETLPSLKGRAGDRLTLPFREGPGVGSTGLLFESDNSDDLAEKMLWALDHPEEVKQIIAQAQIDVQKYAWKNVKQQLMKIYE